MFLKYPEILKSAEVGNEIPNMNRYLLSICVELVLKVVLDVWSLGARFWCFNISC